eukprot:CFRG3788T1
MLSYKSIVFTTIIAVLASLYCMHTYSTTDDLSVSFTRYSSATNSHGKKSNHTTKMVKNAVVIKPTGEHKATVIFAHGLGDTGHGWSPVVEMIKHPNVKYILPHAPTRPVSLNMGMSMPAWFDIFGLTASAKEDATGVRESAERIIGIVNEEIMDGVPSEKIIIGGFSQGGAIGLYAGLMYDKPLAAIVGLSTWLPLNTDFPAKLNDANKKTPLFLAHGDSDQVVSIAWGKATNAKLEEWGYNSTWQTYGGMGHSTCPQELNDLRVFLSQFFS